MTKKRNKMNFNKIIITGSILLNIVLIILLVKHSTNKTNNINTYPVEFKKENDLTNKFYFEKIFIEKNDSVYKMVYNRSFEDLPVQAYLLACTYYLIKKDSSSKKDIEMISSEIKAIYGKSPSITFFK